MRRVGRERISADISRSMGPGHYSKDGPPETNTEVLTSKVNNAFNHPDCDMCRLSLPLALVFLSCSPGVAETWLHPDLRGVATDVGNIRMNVRPGGRVTSSMRIGRMVIHSSNFGLSGVSYYGSAGRVDTFQRGDRIRKSFGWYTPFRQQSPGLRRPRAQTGFSRRVWRQPGLRPQGRFNPLADRSFR